MIQYKSVAIAWICWFLFGAIGGHNFYLGRKGAGLAQAFLTISLVGIIISAPWVLIDAFSINSRVREYNDRIWQQHQTNEAWRVSRHA